MPDKYVKMAVEIADTVSRKNADYGAAFEKSYRKYGWLSYLIRVDDKLNRLRTLVVDGKTKQVSESVEDTLTDIIGYSLLMLEIQKRRDDAGLRIYEEIKKLLERETGGTGNGQA